MQNHIGSFRDVWLEEFFCTRHHIKNSSRHTYHASSQARYHQCAVTYLDLRSPPGNRYEELNGKLEGYSSIRINQQYRLIFKWVDGKAEDLYLDPHKY
ncbi:TPA: type II toxin-antitoxin system RelE/ParE family toxin [Klebsiella aerogenes]